MGLLSDPEYGSVKWVRVLKKIHNPLCFLCYIGALVWFVMLGNREFNNDTYFSENALLPGLVTNDFNQERAARKFYDDFQMELEKYEDTDEMPVPWLVAMMSQLRLEVYTHNFTLNYPMGNGQVFKGTNVYGILRAPRTSSLEALVVTTPYRPPSSHQKSTNAGIALMLAFAQFARPQKYWAKDIIFLITEHEQLGMQAWLEAYHGIQSEAQTFHTSLGSFWKPGTPSLDLADLGLLQTSHNKCLNPGILKARSGSIQAAINLEFHTPKIKYIEVKVEGLNGQLPNLDLVNLVHKLCVKSGIHHSYKNSYSWIRSRSKMEDWLTSVKNMLSMVSSQATGVPNGNHGLFHRFGIEAVTLEGRDENDPAGRPPRVASLAPANFHKLGVALESILRSLNNLLERFHQSYFFYLLASTQRFISIGQYMPALCLLCVAILIRALALWVTIQQDDDEEKAKKHKRKHKAKQSEVPGDQETEELNQKGDSNDETAAKEKEDSKHFKREESSISVVNIGANYLLVHLLGYAVMNSPLLLCQIGLRSELSIFNGLSIISLVLMAVSPHLLRVMRSGPMTYEELSLVNIMLLVELATVCLCVGMHNFALGLTLAVVYTPLALTVGVSNKKGRTFGHYLRRAFCMIVNPLLLVTLCLIAYSAYEFPDDSWPEMFGRGRDAAIQAVMFSIVDSMIYGNWLFNLLASTILPIWIIFWQILCNSTDVTRN